ncbi:hypothetical protein HPP92_021119 [Vanilla planifolia]|uniref:GH18 domain-containing protein n=1 Tax=Vanilla planifolia TaxID=51239 RepID=A0A835Q0Y6_VANPL|nr:hypothetical protein HPP92_021119 [Vanilla planifolia]
MPFFRLIVFLIIAARSALAVSQQCGASPRQVRAGYWLSSSGRYSPVSTIDVSLYTHIYYFSLSVDPLDSTISISQPDELPLLAVFSATLKKDSSSVKTLLSIATDAHRIEESNAAFSAMAADPIRRAAFIESTMEIAREHSFDGLDLSWQYPSSPADMANLQLLLAEWRARVGNETVETEREPESPLLLTATVYFSGHLFGGSDDNVDYPIDAISRNLDWINVLCFGYQKNSKVAAADAALFAKTSHSSTSYGIGSWLDSGVASCKMVMGIPLYGRSWYLKNKEKTEPGAAVVAEGPRQRSSNQSGVMAYFEVEETLRDNGSTLVYDKETVFAYLHHGDLWVSFDNPEAVEQKINFARRKDLLGYFLFPISFDDSNHTISQHAFDAWSSYGADGGSNGDQEVSSRGTSDGDQDARQAAEISGSVRWFPNLNANVLFSFLLLIFLVFIHG